MDRPAQAFLDFEVTEVVQTLGARDAILYALSVGYGAEPLDAAHLRYIHERDLIPTPTLANIAAHPGPWMKALGVDWDHVVHAEQRLTLHRPIPLDTPLTSRTRGLSIVDRGQQKGMFATFERALYALAGEGPFATILQTNACRADGGCGSAGTPPPPLSAAPDRPPDTVITLDIPQSAAALYRLNGDLNPLHIDPEAARRAGFARPLLHGLCTFGYAGYAISKACADAGTGLADIRSIAARFSAPTLPGESLCVQIWRDGEDIRFRGTVPQRAATVLDFGMARLG